MSGSDKKSTDSSNKQKKTDTTDSKDPGRRKILKAGGVVATSALVPEKWQKPVVDTVLLPAHAQTSGPLIGAILISASVAPTRPVAAMMAKHDTGILDTFINPAHASSHAPTPAPTPAPTTAPTPAPAPTPSTGAPTPSPTAATPSPGCAATGQCVAVTPPNASNQVNFSITNVGSGLLAMTGTLTYLGVVAGITISGFFTDMTFTNTQGTVISSGCNGTYTAVLGGSCIPAA